MESAIQSLTAQRCLLKLEYDEEKQAFSDVSRRIGLARLAERGDAWAGIRVGRSYYNSLNQRVVEIFRTDGSEREAVPSDVPDHHFESGKAVAFFIAPHPGSGDSKFRFLFTGTVSYVDGDRMVVAIPESAEVSRITDVPGAGVMLSFDETTYKAMFDAIDRVIKADGRIGELRDLFYSRRPAATLRLEPMTFPYLNASQQRAVNRVLAAKDVAIVHGPPGTGKTTTLVEAINETLRRESQVLVCAQSNMAVDWICEQLVDRGIHVLRIGNPVRVNDKMLAHTYERRFESHPDYPALWSLRKAIRELQHAGRRSSEQWHQKMDRLKSRAAELEIRIDADLFNSAHVVASTLVGSASKVLSNHKFSTLFIDEAAQALEAACWIAIRRAGRVVLAGDHCQLPPVVKSVEAMRGGLGRSLMERLVENHPEAVELLTVQYRMHTRIMDFSAQWFYGGRMTAAPEVAHRNILDFDKPIEWIDTSAYADALDPGGNADADSPQVFRETVTGETMGRINRDEAALTLLTLQKFINRVAMTRARMKLIIIGDAPTLTRHPFYRRLYKYATDTNDEN